MRNVVYWTSYPTPIPYVIGIPLPRISLLVLVLLLHNLETPGTPTYILFYPIILLLPVSRQNELVSASIPDVKFLHSAKGRVFGVLSIYAFFLSSSYK